MSEFRELHIDFTLEARSSFRAASDTTRFDAAPILSFLSHGFQVTWFKETYSRLWVALIKPKPDVAEQFALRLEHVVIGHGFDTDVQQRTFLQEAPEDIAYRVDPQLRFIASRAPLLRAAAAAWAAEHRIAVVPIESGDLDPDAVDNHERLFALLSESLWRRDVFDFPDPVIDPAEFYGREQQVRQLVTKSLLGQSTAVFGLRKVGKTSLLRRAESLLVADKGTIYAVAFLQCNSTKFKSGRWWNVVLEVAAQWAASINGRAGKAGSDVKAAPRKLKALLEGAGGSPNGAAVAEALEKDFEKLQKAARQVARDSGVSDIRFVAFFDEVDELYPTSADPGYWKKDYFDLWNTLQVLKRGLDSPNELLFVLGGVNPVGVEAGALLDRPNPLFELSTMYLAPMEAADSKALLGGLGERGTGLCDSLSRSCDPHEVLQ